MRGSCCLAQGAAAQAQHGKPSIPRREWLATGLAAADGDALCGLGSGEQIGDQGCCYCRDQQERTQQMGIDRWAKSIICTLLPSSQRMTKNDHSQPFSLLRSPFTSETLLNSFPHLSTQHAPPQQLKPLTAQDAAAPEPRGGGAGYGTHGGGLLPHLSNEENSPNNKCRCAGCSESSACNQERQGCTL